MKKISLFIVGIIIAGTLLSGCQSNDSKCKDTEYAMTNGACVDKDKYDNGEATNASGFNVWEDAPRQLTPAEDSFFKYYEPHVMINVNPPENYNLAKSEEMKPWILDAAYTQCKNLGGTTRADSMSGKMVATDPYGYWTSLEFGTAKFAINTGAIVYLCPEYLDGFKEFVDKTSEKSLNNYLIEVCPSYDGWTNSDRAEVKEYILDILVRIGTLKG